MATRRGSRGTRRGALLLSDVVPVLENFGFTVVEEVPTVLAAQGVRSATLVEQGTNAPGANLYRLRRFLDGRSVSEAEFDAYLSGALDLVDAAAARGRRR